MIRQDEIAPVAVVRPATSTRSRVSAATIGGYLVLALLSLIYLIPLCFVLFVSLMSSRQFAMNAAISVRLRTISG